MGKCRCGNKLPIPRPSATAPAAPWERGPAPTETRAETHLSAALPASGEVECPQCGMRSRPGANCEWCGTSLRRPIQTPPTTADLTASPAAPGRPVEMPGVVRVVRLLYRIGVGIGCFLLLVGLWFFVMGLGSGLGSVTANSLPSSLGRNVSGILPYLLWFAFIGGLMALYLWIIRALGQGVTAVWYVELVLSIIGLPGFPIGTIINGLILFYWVKPETKAWFGLS